MSYVGGVHEFHLFSLAFGPIVACMNHNCDPNVFVQYKDNKDAHLVALRDIEPGEQLFIAYIDVDEPLEVHFSSPLIHLSILFAVFILGEEKGTSGAWLRM